MTVTPRQLPLGLQHEPGYERENLIVAYSNRAAVDLIDRWPQWPSPIAMLTGPAGAGKTHLAAIWQSVSNAHIIDPRQINAQALEIAARHPVLIDDIGSEEFDETGLFHLINTVRQHAAVREPVDGVEEQHGHQGLSKVSLLMTSRLLPSQWNIKLPDLASRLKAATIVEISEPDDALLTAVIYKLFADRQVSVEPHVISYLVSRIERSLVSAISVVDYLDQIALEQKCKITRPLAVQALQVLQAGNTDGLND